MRTRSRASFALLFIIMMFLAGSFTAINVLELFQDTAFYCVRRFLFYPFPWYSRRKKTRLNANERDALFHLCSLDHWLVADGMCRFPKNIVGQGENRWPCDYALILILPSKYFIAFPDIRTRSPAISQFNSPPRDETCLTLNRFGPILDAQ